MASKGKNAVHRIFAYGTLKSGQPNHHHLKTEAHGRCKFVATACTDVEYPLVIATVWNIPLLLYAPGKGQIVFGEVYDVDDQCLQWLDDFEGHPHHYQRDRVKVRILSRVTDNNETDSKSSESERDTDYCWVYYLKKFDSSLLLLESYSSYDAYGKHNRTYVYQEDRSDEGSFEEALKDECDKIKQE